MLKFFKKRNNETTENTKDKEKHFIPKSYNEDKVRVFYEGEVLSPEYTATTLVFTEDGDIRQDFNDQSYPYHNLFPDGKGKLIYKFEDQILEEYEGDFQAGQYHGEGRLVDRYGEIFEGTFFENKFSGK